MFVLFLSKTTDKIPFSTFMRVIGVVIFFAILVDAAEPQKEESIFRRLERTYAKGRTADGRDGIRPAAILTGKYGTDRFTPKPIQR